MYHTEGAEDREDDAPPFLRDDASDTNTTTAAAAVDGAAASSVEPDGGRAATATGPTSPTDPGADNPEEGSATIDPASVEANPDSGNGSSDPTTTATPPGVDTALSFPSVAAAEALPEKESALAAAVRSTGPNSNRSSGASPSRPVPLTARPVAGAELAPLPPPQPQPPKTARRKSRARSLGHFTAGSKDTFFFDNDYQKDIGVGTVGLYAAKAVPVVAETYRRHGRRRHAAAGGGGGGGDANGSGATTTEDDDNVLARTFYTTTFYRAPAHDHVSVWERRDRAHAEWRSSRLARSLYHTFANHYVDRSGGAAAAANWDADHAVGEGGGRRRSPGSSPASSGAGRETLTFGADGLPVETSVFEQARLRAIAAARRAKEAARSDAVDSLSRGLLDRRHRSRVGEALDLPRAYYARVQETFPDKTDTAHITSADHRRACEMQRLQQRQERALSEERRHDQVQKDKARAAAQLSEARAGLANHVSLMTHDLPHISRRAAAAKREGDEERRQAEARLRRAEREADRRLYSQIADEEEGEALARQRGLQHKVGRVVAHTGGAGRPPSAPAAAAAEPGEGTAAHTAAVVAGTAPAVFATTSTNFLAEMKTWQANFQSPNTAPVTGADATVRREWLRQLDDGRVQMNRETVQFHREQQPAKLMAAREAQANKTAAQATEGRHQRRLLENQRTAAETLRRTYAGEVYVAQREQQERVRAVRAAQVDSRRHQAERLRLEERKAEAETASRNEDERAFRQLLVASSKE